MTAPARELRVALVAGAAMAAFAGNSLLCRMALAGGAIDPASFTAIRFGSGALALLACSAAPHPSASKLGGSWTAAAVLFVYAVPFALAYHRLDAGTGALALFGVAQITMVAWGLLTGERPSSMEWLGLALALSGLIWLAFPGLATSPSPAGVALMTLSGVAWGAYSLMGRSAVAPAANITGTFLRMAPATFLWVPITWPGAHVSLRGALLALVAGTITSGGGYVLWYRALRHLSATRAAVLQLSVPALAALGGAFFLSEALTLRLSISAALILGGVAAAIMGRSRLRLSTTSDSLV